MVCTRVLTALVLLSLFSSGVSVEDVDQNTLVRIIRFFETHYKPHGQTSSSDGLQYAVAINVPAEQCGSGFNENTFLSEENPENVRKDITDKKKRLYQGTRLVAATPKGTGSTAIHSERVLLLCGDNNQAVSHIQNLLGKYKDDCVVFYTYNSPCLEYCLNQAGDDREAEREKKQRERGRNNVTPAVKKCILNSLSMLTNHRGPKAFVFNRVYRKDTHITKLAAALTEVAQKVPLYKCDTTSCTKCLNNNNDFNNQCLPQGHGLPSHTDL